VVGATATYALSATADFVLRATPEGFEQSVVLKAAPAKAPTVRLPLTLANLTFKATANGGYDALDADGKAAFSVAAPVMYSAARDPETEEPTQVQALGTTLSTDGSGGQRLDLSAAMAFLSDPKTVYPVTIDPVIASASRYGDTWITNGNSTPKVSDYRLAIGVISSQPARALLRFDETSYLGNHVTSATLKLRNYASFGCTPQPVTAYPVSSAYNNNTVVWSGQPSVDTSAAYKGTASFAYGDETNGCANNYGSIDVTNMVSAWSFGTIPNNGIELRASETDAAQRKYFCSMNLDTTNTTSCTNTAYYPTLSITYNSYPWPPQLLTHTPRVIGTTGSVYSTSTTPTIKATIGNTDGTPVTLNGEVSYDPAYPAEGTGVLWTGSKSGITPNTEGAVTVSPALPTGMHLRWRVRGSVTTAAGGTDFGAWSGYQQMVLNTVAPAAPTLACTSYPANAWTASTGAAVTCSLSTTSGDGSGYYWSLDNPTPTTLVDDGSNNGATQTFTINPSAGQHTLYARTRDTAFNLSTTTARYTFGVGAGGVITPANGSQTQKALALTGQSSSARTEVTYSYRAGTDTALPWITVPTANVTPPGSSTPITSWPQTGTVSGSLTSYAQLNWNVAATIAAAGGGDGIVQVRACFTQAGANQSCDTGSTITLSKTSFSPTAATVDLGPGTVSLVTGDFAVDESDVSVAGLSIARTHTTLSPPTANTGASGVFGAGWTVSAFGPDAGAGDLSLDDQSAKGYVVLADSSGSKSTYVKNGSTYTGVGDASDGSVLAKSTTIRNPVDTSDATNYTGWQLTDLDGTTTSYLQLGTSSTYMSKWVDEAGKEGESTYVRDGNGRITRILAPVPAGVSCTTMVAGCKALNITYATATTATGTTQATWGDYTGLVKQITYTGYDPATSAMTTRAVASYQYDSTGHLRAQWDPRISPTLVTTYTYAATGRITTLTPPGRAAWTMTYETSGRLSRVSRTDPANGTAVQAVAYDIPLSGTGTPIDLSFLGAAVFPASRVPAADANGVTTPAAADWPYADLTYTDIEGRTVNSASYGAGAWQIDTTRHDPATGNTLWQLSARNRAQALNPTADTDPYTGAQASSAARADLLSTQSVYSADGVNLISTTGPAHPIYVASGEYSSVRVKVTNTYDQGAPAGGPYRLLTTTTTASVPLDGTATTANDTVTKLTGYDPIDGASSTGATSGWTLRAPTTQTTVMGTSTSTSDVVTATRYDDAGRPTESRMPLSDGTDAGTTLTAYYTVAANATAPACGNKPQWAGSVCKSEPKTQPSGATIPSTVTTYTLWGASDTIVETSGATTRTSHITYDGAGRPTASSLVVSPAADGGTALPDGTAVYDPATGDTTSVTSGGSSISTVTDVLGRRTSYTDADGTATTMTYTIDGQVKTRSDGKGTYTYTYDGTDAAGAAERRGLLTALDVGMGTAPSTFTAAYDTGGNLIKQIYPNGINAVTTYDNTDDPRRLAYSKNAVAWMTFDTGSDRDGHTVFSGSPMSFQHYGYDNASRLTDVSDNVNGACTTRKYVFSKNGNRTALTTGAAPDTGGTCQNSTTTSTSSTYDTADRVTTSWYTYDKFGRTLTAPATDVTGGATLTAGYYADDKVATLTQATKTKAFTLDPMRRLRQVTDTTSGTETRRITNHYPDTEDSPSWIATTIGTTITWDRNVIGIDGNLAVLQPSTGIAQIQLPDLHGDIVATVDDDTTAVATNAYFEQTEYGTPRTQNTTNPSRYGWLGTKQRSADTLAGIVLMGARLYNPTTGRFAGVDPVVGANVNAYSYPVDPVNMVDLDGREPRIGDGNKPAYLNDAEWRAIVNKEGARTYSKADYKSAMKKYVKAQKYANKRNISKRLGNKRKGGRGIGSLGGIMIPNPCGRGGVLENSTYCKPPTAV
jgi:RHS repeat-associated protein